MHLVLADTLPPAETSRRIPSWHRCWPWLVAALPWIFLLNYLRLEWSANPQYSYGFVVPLLALYLVLQLWPTRPHPRPLGRPAWLGMITATLAAMILPLLLLVEASPEWRLIGWLLAAPTIGLTAAVILQRAGWPWLIHFAFPVLFILAAVPWPTSLEWKVMTPLMQGDAATAVEILNWSGLPAVQHQNIIQLPNGDVGVDEACSGIRSLQTSLMIALFIGAWLQLRWLRRVILLGAALTLTYFFNLLRTLALVTLSANGGEASLHRWHDTIGLSVLGLSMLGLWFLATALREGRAPVSASDFSPIPRATAWPRRSMLVLGIWLVAAFAGTQAWFDWHQSGALPVQRWTIDWPKNLATYQAVEIPVEARTSLKYDTGESSAARWQRLDAPFLWLGYFLDWQPGRETSILSSNHHPDVCLPATGKPLVANYGVVRFPVAGLTLPAKVYQFDDGGQPLFVFYCVWPDARTASLSAKPPAWVSSLRRTLLPSTPAEEFDYRLAAIAEGRRNEGQQVLELGLWGANNVTDAKREFSGELAQLVRRLP